MAEYGIEPFDLVVANLYPFSGNPSVDLIDIGGPAMVRAGAKNHGRVGVVVDPADYDVVLDELRRDGRLAAATRVRLARKAFAHTAAYDAAIVDWLDDGEPFPDTLHLTYERAPIELRYGENPHQRAAIYRSAGAHPWWEQVTQHSGLALCYLNLYDADAAWLLVHDLERMTGRPAGAIIKHANPCGAAVAPTIADAYQLAYECDERSAFGGIVAVSRPIDGETVERMVAAAQADVVIAPGFDPGTIDRLVAKRKNTRILEAPAPEPDRRHLRPITGGLLVQEPHRFVAGRADWRVVTRRQPTDAEWRDAELAWRICGWVKSNAIVLVKDGQAVGIGAGQQNRVEAGQLAAQKAAGRAKGGACASDAFYPFPDGIEAAAEAGVSVIVQPGGAMRDEANIARGRRARRRHGLHRRTALPALTCERSEHGRTVGRAPARRTSMGVGRSPTGGVDVPGTSGTDVRAERAGRDGRAGQPAGRRWVWGAAPPEALTWPPSSSTAPPWPPTSRPSWR